MDQENKAQEHRPKKKLGCWWFLVPPALLFMLFVVQMWGPSPKLRVGKDTTYLSTHLDSDGLPDYVGYVHDRSRGDVKPDENAAVLYWSALWPGELGGDVAHQEIVCDALGMDMPNPNEALASVYVAPQGNLVAWIDQNVLPPLDAKQKAPEETTAEGDVEREDDSGDFFVTEDFEEGEEAEYELSRAELERSELVTEMAHESISRSMRVPWKREQMPPIAKWVDQNQKPLDMLVEGAARPKYYNPSPNMLDGSDDSMIAMLLPGVQMLRHGARSLTVRAMFYVGEGEPELAWRDLQACHRMGRHASSGWTLVEQLVGIAIDAMASKGTQALLHHGNLTKEQAEQIRKDLTAMGPMPSMKASMSDGERLMFLDIVKRMATGKMDANNVAGLMGNGGGNVPTGIVTSTNIDWNLVMQRGNEWYDRLSDACELPREERLVALGKFENDIENLSPQNNPSLIAGSLISPKARSELVADVMLSLFLPALSACSEASDRQLAIYELNRLAAALAAHRANEGGYPDKLEQLVPGILKQLPTDVFSPKGQPFIYQKTPDGYLLYSVFRNGIDDGGRDMEGRSDKGKWLTKMLPHDRENSDLVILMPLAEFNYSLEED